MLYTIITTTNARRDIQEAIGWENMREQGLGKRFFNDLEQKLQAIALTPRLGSFRYENVRCLPMKVFQYLIHYYVDDASRQIFILVVLHTSRKPIWEI